MKPAGHLLRGRCRRRRRRLCVPSSRCDRASCRSGRGSERCERRRRRREARAGAVDLRSGVSGRGADGSAGEGPVGGPERTVRPKAWAELAPSRRCAGRGSRRDLVSGDCAGRSNDWFAESSRCRVPGRPCTARSKPNSIRSYRGARAVPSVSVHRPRSSNEHSVRPTNHRARASRGHCECSFGISRVRTRIFIRHAVFGAPHSDRCAPSLCDGHLACNGWHT